jgi:hypothetical protein
MVHKVDKLSVLPFNKTVVFCSPLEGEDAMVRTGTTGDGSCMFHAVLHACSKSYVNSDKVGRSKFVRQLRASITGDMDEEKWQSLGGGLIAKLPFQEALTTNIRSFFSMCKSGEAPSGKSFRTLFQKLEISDKHNIILEILSFKDFKETILPAVYSKTKEGTVNDIATSIVLESSNHTGKLCREIEGLTNDNQKKLQNLVEKTIEVIVNHSRKTTYKIFMNSLKTLSEDVDNYTIGLISDRFNRDIYFLDGKTRMPYMNVSSENIKGRKSVIIMWVNRVHYETVGRLLHGNRIQREFDHDDILVKKLHMFLLEPEQVAQYYPELASYVPHEFRARYSDESESSNVDDSTDESSDEGVERSGSDSYHSSSDESEF